MVRDATFADTAAVMLLLQDGFARSIYAGSKVGIDIPTAKKLYFTAVQRHGGKNGGACWVQVAERDGVINGLMLATLARVYGIGTKLMATDMFWYATKDVDPRDPFKLALNMVEWARSSPHVAEVKCGTSGIVMDAADAAGVMLTRLGMKSYGEIYRMEV